MIRLERVPFLRLGKFNGNFEVTRETLANIHNNFLNEKRDIPIFIGHNDFFTSGRGIDAQRTNGWIDSMSLEDDTLYFSGNIDEELYSLLSDGTLRGCSGEFFVKDPDAYKRGERTNWFLGGMAILGSNIPAVDIARITRDNLVKRAYKNVCGASSYLNSGVYLAQDTAKVVFEARLLKFLALNDENKNGEDDRQMSKGQDSELGQIREDKSLAVDEAKSLHELALSLKRLEDRIIDLEREKIDQVRLLNANFRNLTYKLEGNMDVITTHDELLNRIDAFRLQNGIENFGDAELAFKNKYAHLIKLEEEM